MKAFLYLIIGAVLAGCASYPRELVRQQYGCEISNSGLWDTTRANNKPKLKIAYPHGNNRLLRVIQSLEGGVLVSAEMDFWEKENLKSGNLPEKKLNIYVETTDSYVDDEYLCGELRANNRQKHKYHIITEDVFFSKEKDGVYRNGKIYREKNDCDTGKCVEKKLIKTNHAKVCYDTSNLELVDVS